MVFIGLSKSGKTTITTTILGFKLKKTKIKGIPTLQPIKILEGEYSRLVNSPEMRSITRNPAFFRISEDFLEDVDDEGGCKWFLVDCPGFEDSAGF